MATLKQVSQDFDRCFRYRRFPCFRLAPLIILIFCGLVLLGSLFFEFDQNELFYYPTWKYSLFIKLLPKIVLLIWIVRYNIRHKVQTADNDYNRFWYFVSFLFLILFFGLLFFLFKEWVGLLANFAITSLSGKVSIDVLSFFIFSLPAIIVTAYFQLVISNQITLLIVNTFGRRK